GAERVVGVRRAGEVFGEVPVVLDTPFLVSFRAVEQSRVMRIEAKDFQTLAASAPQVSGAVRARAEGRVRGLQEIAAAPAPPRLGLRRPFTARQRACRRYSSSEKRQADRPVRRRLLRIIWDFHLVYPAVNWPIARSSRRSGSARRLS